MSRTMNNLPREVLFAVKLQPTGELTLEASQDRLQILRDGKVVEGCEWTAKELAKAIVRFRELSGQLPHP